LIRDIRLNVSIHDCERKRSSDEGIKSAPGDGCADACAFTNDANYTNLVATQSVDFTEYSDCARFGIVSDKFRNRKDGFDDKVMVVSCGLWNLSSEILLN